MLSVCLSVLCPFIHVFAFVLKITSELLSSLSPNLAWWCIIMGQGVMQYILGYYLQGQGYSEGLYNQNMAISTVLAELLILLQSKSGWLWIVISQTFEWNYWVAIVKVKVNIVWWCIILSQCLAKTLFCYYKGQGHSKGMYNQNIVFCTISLELLIYLQPDLVWWCPKKTGFILFKRFYTKWLIKSHQYTVIIPHRAIQLTAKAH